MENEIIIYQPDETIKLDVRFEKETVWLSIDQMAELFQRNNSVIGKHVRNVFKENELVKKFMKMEKLLINQRKILELK